MLWKPVFLCRAAVGLGLIVGLGGCPVALDEGEGASDSSSTSTSTSNSEAEAPSETGDPGAFVGVCAAGCSVAADCCLTGVIDCPGDYPNDWTCEAGLCRRSGCQADEQCGSIGNFPNLQCHPIEGIGSCFEPCVDDLDCIAVPDSSCVGVADDGARYCTATLVCQVDSDCAGQGVCEIATGVCGCRDDDDCVASGMVCADP
jgi:hypothetical protein